MIANWTFRWSFIAARRATVLLAAAAATTCFPLIAADTPLTSIEYRITGTLLRVSPAAVAVPKGIPGSVLISVISGGGTNTPASAQLGAGAYVEAILRGPGFTEPLRLVGAPNAPLMLPAINLVGDYQLDNIRLVDAETSRTRMEGSPFSVPVRVFEEILISRVTSRPLTLQEIQDKGIVIDDLNFRTVEFEVAFVLDGKTIPVQFPVVAPKFKDSVELIPAAELEARLREAAALNQVISSEVVQLPPELTTANLNIQIQGINFQPVDEGEPKNLTLTIPPIPALMVIPGNIGFLNQFFSVKIYTENGAPVGSGLSVDSILATLKLPAGPDRIPAVSYAEPGDDPLRFARLGPEKIIRPALPVVQPGPDGEMETADDVSRLQPAETGQAEFLVEGLREGLHVMDLDLAADLHGLAAGVVRVKGKAAGSVLVRNPKFSFAFSHPRTVRFGEPYQASITVLNTGITPANLVQVTLNRNSLSGATLEPGQVETIALGTLMPGQTATATYRLVAQRTGQISFSNLTTSDDSTVGRFRFTMGIDERGVPLSPDTLALPDFVNRLPSSLVAAANRVLGQALSIATAAQLPPGVVRIDTGTITRRVLDLAEAGQRVQYGDPPDRVLPDLLRDWQGGRKPNAGFDQLLRETDAGKEWREALFASMEAADPLDGTQRLLTRAPDLAGLGQEFVLAGAGPGQLRVDLETNSATVGHSSLPYALVYAGTNGVWAVTPAWSNAVYTWTFTNGPAAADMAVLLVGANGRGQQLRWVVPNPPPAAVYQFTLNEPGGRLRVDLEADGSIDDLLNPLAGDVSELPPTVVAVEQDLTVVAGRPASPCVMQGIGNYGTVVAVVFSKPMTQAGAGSPEAYVVEGGNGANSAQMQPSGRVALLNLRQGISGIRPRKLTITGAADLRGNLVVARGVPIRSLQPGTSLPLTGGVAVRGRVLRGDGSTAGGVPVTLTMYDQAFGTFGCESWVRRVSQVLTDSGGNFDFDFVLSGVPYSLSATDTGGLSTDALKVIMDATVKDTVERQRIEELANSAGTRDTLLGMFAASSLPQAIARVEGLDRAIVRDFVAPGSGREGQEVPVALRFRGRATVKGVIVAEDGLTPVPNAAVNLYPDPDSRELGRGLFSDSNGSVTFLGVPLGVYSVDAKTSDNRSRTVVGLLDTPGGTANIVIALPRNPVLHGTLRGRVFDADNLTPQPNARVFVGKYEGNTVKEVVRIVEASLDGSWEATNLPIRSLDLVAVSFDGKRKGLRLSITPVADAVTFANISLEAGTRVYGRVQFDDGRPAANALVAGGVALVRSDARGNFELEGVPVGDRTISAGLERNPAAGIDFPRLGSANASIIAGTDNYVVVKLRAAGRVFGKVLDGRGQPVPNVRVAIPLEGGFYWTDADAGGNYVFENLGLGDYTVSAPANATAPKLNEEKLMAQIRSGDEDQILAAFQEAVSVFVGADDPLVTGEHHNFRPATWGFTKASLRFDGASVNADLRYIVQGTVSGKVLNGQGVPIGARVRLTGMGPSLTGRPVMTIRGERDSDPATGEFVFPNQLLAGPWGLQAASPFFPVIATQNGFTTEIDPDATNITLQFPPAREVNGRIAGRVYNPDGSLAGAGVRVRISLSADYEILTDTNGFFDTQMAVPAQGYSVQAFDPSSGLRGLAGVNVTPGITNYVDVRLLTRNSAVAVTVLRGNGLPAPGARIQLEHGSYPYEAPLFAIADTNGAATFGGLWEGAYAVSAQFMEGSTRVSARDGGAVGPDKSRAFNLRLGATGVIEGTFVKRDLTTPVDGAQVAIGNLGFATTDATGFFRFDGVPPGNYQLVTSDPVTGAYATTTATITYADQVLRVQLIESPRGVVSGLVLDSYASAAVGGATVRIAFSDGLTSSRTATTGPDGAFSFPGSPVGGFRLDASYTIPGSGGVSVSGSAPGVLTPGTLAAGVNIQLQPLAFMPIRVVRMDGVTPAINTRVSLSGNGVYKQQDTSDAGEVLFANLPPGGYTLRAISHSGGELHNGIELPATVSSRGTNAALQVRLPGIGALRGLVLASDGATPVQNAEIILQLQTAPFAGESRTELTGADGRFSFDDVPIGSYRVSAASVSLAAAANGSISTNGQTNEVTLRLGDSGSLAGRVVRADRITPVGGIDVAIEYASQTANPGHAVFRTGADGRFHFEEIPVGAVRLTSAAPLFGGIIDLTAVLSTNGRKLELGDVVFDEDLPRIVRVDPPHTAIGVPTRTTMSLLFSEALAAASVKSSGIFVRGQAGIVPASVTLLTDSNSSPRLVQITPAAPLAGKQNYEIIVLSGDLPGPTGGVIGSGPRDLVGRAMAVSFLSRFTTADNTPPVLLSLFPSNSAVQIDPNAVPRLSFDKTLRPTGFVFTVTGPNGVPVSGTAGVGVNGQVLSFVPTVGLQPNSSYALVVSNVFDLAGNRAADEPFISRFTTLDTVGPRLSSLRLAGNPPVVAGYTVPIEAILETNEPGATVHFTRDFRPIGLATNPPFLIQTTLPTNHTTTLRAIATDQYGNDGPVAELVLTIQSNLPPSVRFTRVTPASGPVPSGSFAVVDLSASGFAEIARLTARTEGAVTNDTFATNGPNLRVRAWVPDTALPGGELRVVGEATDIIGRTSGQQSVAMTVADATPPSLAILNPADDALLDDTQPLRLTVLTSDNSTHLHLSLSITGAMAFSNSFSAVVPPNSPATNLFTAPLTNAPPSGGVVTAVVSATDMAGNTVTATRAFVLPGAPPTLTMKRVSPTSGPVPSGSTITVDVNTSVQGTVSTLTVWAAGATTNAITTNATSLRFTAAVPTTAVPGDEVRITAEAVDAIGRSTGRQTLTFQVSDATTPALVLLSPPENALLSYGQPLELAFEALDNSTNLTVGLSITGAVTTTQSRVLELVAGQPATNVFTLAATNFPPGGGSLGAVVTATDQAGNRVSVGRTFFLPSTPPQLEFTRVSPATGPVPSGSSVIVDLAARVQGSGARIVAAVSGATAPLSVTNAGTSLRLQFNIAPTALAGETVTVVAEAIDGIGRRSGPQTLNLTISDGTQPDLAILSPPEATLVNTNEPLRIAVRAGDNSSKVSLTLALSGNLAANQNLELALLPNLAVTNLFSVAVTNVPAIGGPVTATVTAADLAGNRSTQTRVFWMLGPGTTVNWNRQALGQRFTCPNNGRSYTWPDNNRWSQSARFGDPCSSGDRIEVEPSNWSTTNFPNRSDLDVFLTGLGGAPTLLDLDVTLRSLSILSEGGLSMASGSSIIARDFFFANDNTITIQNCCSAPRLILDGGTMAKVAGTGVSAIQPGIILQSTNGTIASHSGTLALSGNGSSYAGGGFNVSSGAAIELVPPNQDAYFSGLLAGRGDGTVRIGAGRAVAGDGGVIFNLPEPLFQWTGGTIAAGDGWTNAGAMMLSGGEVRLNGHLRNSGRVWHVGMGGLGLESGARFSNLSDGLYALKSDAGLHVPTCCTPPAFDNYGILLKDTSESNVTVAVRFNNLGGRIEVKTGALILANDGVSTGGTLVVSAGALLDLTGGRNPAWSGQIDGTGAGTVLLADASLTFSPGGSLNLEDGLFQWTGGTLAGSTTNLNVISLPGDGETRRLSGSLDNMAVVRHTGAGRLGINSGSILRNLPGAIYRFETDSGIFVSTCCSGAAFANFGLLHKAGGTNSTSISTVFNNLGGTVQVDAGRLVLANSGGSVDGNYLVGEGAALDLTGGAEPRWSGRMNGAGGGACILAGGRIRANPSVELNFDDNVLQWSGGVLEGPVSNLNVVVISGAGPSHLESQFDNLKLVRHTGIGGLGLRSGAAFRNQSGATYQFEDDGGIYISSCCTTPSFINEGMVRKTGGAESRIDNVLFRNLGGSIDVQKGRLVLDNDGVSSNGTYIVAAGAVLDLAGNRRPTWAGLMYGRGAGRALLAGGTITGNPGVTLDFTNNLFHWNGGILAGQITNANTLSLSSESDSQMDGVLHNRGTVRHAGGGRLGLRSGSYLKNLTGATYRFETDSSIYVSSCCSGGFFENAGLLLKAGGANDTTISASFSNLGGTIQVDAGRLVLANDGASVSGTLLVAANATVDPTGGREPIWSGIFSGSGAGRIELSRGRIRASELTLDFDAGLFHWMGGMLDGTTTNIGEVNLTAAGGQLDGSFHNQGLVRHRTPGTFKLASGAQFNNLPGGEYRFESEGELERYTCCSEAGFNNYGLLRKSGGTNSVIRIPFSNQGGSIQVDRGVLQLARGGFAQGGGALSIGIGGRSVDQFGQLSVNGNAILNGGLNVVLTDGFVPAQGDQFVILSAASLSGAFTNLNLPPGMSVTYSGSTVVLTRTNSGTGIAPFTAPLSIRGSGELLLSGEPHSRLQVWSATNLVAPGWELLETVTITNTTQWWRDPEAVPARQRFYKVAPTR